MLPGRQIVYVHNVYYQGRAEWGPTSNWEITWGTSLERYFGPEVLRFHPDIFGPNSHVESDEALLRLLLRREIKLVVMIAHVGAGWTREFIAKSTLARIHESGIAVVAIWGDITHASQRRELRALRPYVDLNICAVSNAAAKRLASSSPVLYSWVPMVDAAKRKSCDCGALVSFAGTVKGKRARTIEYLRRNGIAVHAAGGEGIGTLTRDEYFTMLGHPMTLGFSENGYESVVNARTFEALTQRTLLLQSWGRETAKVLAPYKEYVPWHSHRDLLSKVESFAALPGVRDEIATAGLDRVAALTNDRLWAQVLTRTGLGAGSQADDLSFVHPVDWTLYQGHFRWLARLVDQIMESPKSEPMIYSAQRARDVVKWGTLRLRYLMTRWRLKGRRPWRTTE